jgi:hypothetical protein
VETPPPATTAAEPVELQPAAPEDIAVERFEALLTAVESRTDDQSERLMSAVLKLGQGANDPAVRASASDRAEEALNRITDTATRNEHPMLGLRYSPLDEAAWWAERLTETEPAPDGYIVFEHLVDALTASTDDDTAAIASAIPAVVPHVPEDELSRRSIGSESRSARPPGQPLPRPPRRTARRSTQLLQHFEHASPTRTQRNSTPPSPQTSSTA